MNSRTDSANVWSPPGTPLITWLTNAKHGSSDSNPKMQPLISRPLALAIIAALIVPSLGWMWQQAVWQTKVDEKLNALAASVQMIRAEAYTRAEAELQFQRLDRIEDRMFSTRGVKPQPQPDNNRAQ